jgi:hypothetical protein
MDLSSGRCRYYAPNFLLINFSIVSVISLSTGIRICHWILQPGAGGLLWITLSKIFSKQSQA